MTDCADLGNCLMPMWMQYAILAAAFLLLFIKVTGKHDPYDRM